MKIAICVPHLRQVEAMFAVALSGLTYFTAKQRPKLDLQVFEFSSSAIPVGRIRLVDRALEWGAQQVLWLDSDMVFPPGSLLRLLDHGLDIVGANYVGGGARPTPVAAALDGLPLHQGKGIEEAGAIGFGVCLTSRKVLEALPAPLFAFEPTPDGRDVVTEDYYFCRKARAAGFRVYVDHDIFTGHIHERTLTMADATRRTDDTSPAHPRAGAQ